MAGRCRFCRRMVLNLFTNGVLERPRQPSTLSSNVVVHTLQYPKSRNSMQPRRGYHSDSSLGPQRKENEGDIQEERHLREEEPVVSSKPWYLQVGTPIQRIYPLAERQRIPDLPQRPPPILKPVLNHLSVDIGLDDLTLLDLRQLDPPAALGDNLLMVLGTARSEKHLHVSAERLCRWLRAEHKVWVYADGLLGRGELKLKLRRKRRKAKLLGRVGSAEPTDVDDGIRTGWICVNVRNVQDGREPETLTADLNLGHAEVADDIAQANIVIQMLTQDKRSDLDLESLWGIEDLQKKSSEGSHPEFLRPSLVSNNVHPSIAKAQQQAFHSFARQCGDLKQFNTDPDPASRTNASESCTKYPNSETREQDETSRKPAGPADLVYDQTRDLHIGTLEAMTDQVDAATPSETRSLLENEPSQLWARFDDCHSLFPSSAEILARLRFLNVIQQKGVPVAKSHFVSALKEAQNGFIEPAGTIFTNGIMALLKPPVSESNVVDAISFLEHAVACGLEFPIEDIRAMFRSTILTTLSTNGATIFSRHAYQRVTSLMNVAYGPASKEDELQAMHACADAGRWDDFWHVWRNFPVHMRARSSELYRDMFACVALRGHQAETMQCLREWVLEMPLEQPPVDMDIDIALAVKACLLVAEPNIVRIASQSNAIGEWVELWRRCDDVISISESQS